MKIKKFFLLSGSLFIVSAVSLLAEAPTAGKPQPPAEIPMPPVVVTKPGRYTFNNTETGAPSKSTTSNAVVPPIVEEAPPEVIVNGKPASQLSDDEIKKFIQGKVKSICQWDREVALLRVAPGYPVTLTFSEPVRSYSVGDEKMLSVQNANAKELRVAALMRPPGDTSLQVVTKSENRYIYHVFLVDNFVNADLVVCVNQGWFFKITQWIPKLITLAVIGAAGFFFYKKFKK